MRMFKYVVVCNYIDVNLTNSKYTKHTNSS